VCPVIANGLVLRAAQAGEQLVQLFLAKWREVTLVELKYGFAIEREVIWTAPQAAQPPQSPV
jgi:hypothetical protein